jgi:transposase
MRRVHLRGHTNIMKRLLIHTGGFNLGLLMRQLIGLGTPQGLQGRLMAVVATLCSLIRLLWGVVTGHRWPVQRVSPIEHRSITKSAAVLTGAREMVFTTGC